MVVSDTICQTGLNGNEKHIFHMRVKHDMSLKQGTES